MHVCVTGFYFVLWKTLDAYFENRLTQYWGLVCSQLQYSCLSVCECVFGNNTLRESADVDIFNPLHVLSHA